MENRIVEIESGILQGIQGYDPRVLAFKGVPYAAPPVGELRWKAPQPARSWEGIKVADQYAPMSCQPAPGGNPEEFWTREIHPTGTEFQMSEDCLYLNVFTPARKGDENLPVLFYIHGGGYKGGYPYEVEFDWEHMAKKGIVVVAVTYRLGVMGFLAHPDLEKENPDAPQGNFGLQDQLAAIQWTKRNIKAFGGNPDKITIAGQSAGAGSVQSLLTSPYSKGLIAGAIIESGITMEFGDIPVGMNPFTLETAYKYGEELFAKAGAATLEEARKIPAEKLVEIEDREMEFGFHFQPVVDHKFLEMSPSDAYKNNKHLEIPVLAGYNLGETRGFMEMWSKLPATVEEYQQFAKRYGEKEKEFIDVSKAVTDQEVYELFHSDAYTDLISGSLLFGYLQSMQGRETYLYEFDAQIPGEDEAGSYHGCEMWFAYDSLARCWRPFTGKHYDLARQTSSYWVNFVKNQNPNGVDTFGNELPEWPVFESTNPYIMTFKEEPKKREVVLTKETEFRMKYACPKVKLDGIVQEITVIEEHGRQLYGTLIKPEKVQELPLIVCSHGYNGSGRDFEQMARYWARNGFAVFCYDFCGGSVNSRSSMATTEMTIFTEKQDLEAVVSYFKASSEIDAKHIVLFGGSQGGLVSALAANDLSEHISGLILMFPALCIADNWNERFKEVSDIPNEEEFWGMRLGKVFFESLRGFKVFDHIGAYQKKVLVTHGNLDPIVSPEYSERLEQIYKDMKLEIFQGEGHGYSEAGNERMAQMVLAFCKEL